MSRTRQLQWSYSAGERGRNRTRVYERPDRGDILLEWYELDAAGEPRRSRMSLGRCTRDDAKARADQVAAKLAQETRTAKSPEPISVRSLFERYEREVTPKKGRSSQNHDRLVAGLFLRSVGQDRPVDRLTRAHWDRFIDDRRTGALAPAGRDRAVPVRDRQVQADLAGIRAVFNWGTRVADLHGRPLIERNPFANFPVPREANPRRPVLSDADYQALLAVASQVHPLCELALLLAHETGHRIGAIRLLRWSDIDWKARSVRWRAENDKLGFEHVTPLSGPAVTALEAARARVAAIGDAWIFPAHGRAEDSRNGDVFRHWWERLEREAGLAPARGRGWHSLRRMFATEMKDAPLRDLAYLGGWKSVATVVGIYQQPDEDTMRDAFRRRRSVGSLPQDLPPTDTTNRHQDITPRMMRSMARRANGA